MLGSQCPECGATYSAETDSCAARFDELLALDHSRREPWGSRHGQAFAAFALQHPMTHGASLDRAWSALWRIYVAGESPARVFGALVAHRGSVPPADKNLPARPATRAMMPSVTIHDLADFAAETYPARLDAWCRAALASWGLEYV
jgi:hypothetical protein